VYDDPRGHYLTAGGALAFMGLVGLGTAGVASVWVEQSFGFIDPVAMALFSTLFLVVAGWLPVARPPAEPQP
jgi:hypothetical protein